MWKNCSVTVNGILVPGGFGYRGIEGKITGDPVCPRTPGFPFLGLCLGMQLSIVEFASHVIGYKDAHSVELDPNTTHPVIASDAGSERCRGYRRHLKTGLPTLVYWIRIPSAYQLYGQENYLTRRHRHRYEVNNDYRAVLTEHGHASVRIVP